MRRIFNGRPLELLAPAGNFDIYKAVIDSACDAVYCGGQVLNMRMIRKGFNFSNTELKEAVLLAGERGKKLYVTVNSLLDRDELAVAEDYLGFLNEIQPHGLIIQDMAILDLVQKNRYNLALHGSVMMNIHNLGMVNFLKKQGISRVVLSREMPLKDVRRIADQSDVELEYFTHGDMCIAHGSQCLYSSWVFGMSGSRGRCLKPCRWPYSRPGYPDDKPFPLAVKDLSLYSHLSDLILAGVSSFKIEGRMREKDFITRLIDTYGDALDRFLDDPLGGAHGDPEDMEPFKKRDFSTAYAFGTPGLSNINSRGEGTGKFYSTGKMFSTPAKEKEVKPVESVDQPVARGDDLILSVRVNSPDQAELALENGARRIYLSAEPFLPDTPASLKDLNSLYTLCESHKAELFLGFPRMMSDTQQELFQSYLDKSPSIHGILAGHTGILEIPGADAYPIHCDTAMNLYNARAIRFLSDHGVCGWTPSVELHFASLKAMPADAAALGAALQGEVVLHGFPTVMYMDHDVSGSKEAQVVLETPESPFFYPP